MKLAFIGDIVGKPGREMIRKHLSWVRKKYDIDFVIANYENVSHGFGITKKNYFELRGYGIDAMTGGNHSWDKKEIFELFNQGEPLIRPINYPDKSPGCGYMTLEVAQKRLAIVNVMGNYTMPMSDNPFLKMQEIISRLQDEGTRHIVVDMHAEATSEKYAMMHIFKENLSALFGTHTHVGTDDLMVADGCCYVTDVGLTGCRDQVIGVDRTIPIERFLTGIGQHFDIPKQCQKILQLIIFELNDEGRAIEAQKLRVYEDGDVWSQFAKVESFN